MRVFRPIHLIVVAVLSLLAAGCGKPADAKKDTTKAVAEAIAVSTVKVEFADIAIPIVATGTIAPIKQTDIGPSVDGIIEEVKVGVGSVVKKGDVLFRTRDVDIKLQIRELEQQAALARAQLTNASNELRRQETLKAGGWASQARMDTTQTNVAVATAQLGVWEARLATARQALKDSVVRAPYDGVITRKDIYEGRYMATRGGSMPGGPSGVVQIMEISTVAAIVNLPETYLEQIEVGLPAKVTISGISNVFDSKIAILNHRVDDRTRSVEVRLGVKNDDLKIKPGLYCRVDIMPKARKVLVVARKAVLGSEGARYAFTAENGRAKKISLTARDLDGERLEITSNLPAGTVFLTGPHLGQLVDGMAVSVADEKSKSEPASSPKAVSL